jgi:hypothetical protein
MVFSLECQGTGMKFCYICDLCSISVSDFQDKPQ